jgi:hypothetical protein
VRPEGLGKLKKIHLPHPVSNPRRSVLKHNASTITLLCANPARVGILFFASATTSQLMKFPLEVHLSKLSTNIHPLAGVEGEKFCNYWFNKSSWCDSAVLASGRS